MSCLPPNPISESLTAGYGECCDLHCLSSNDTYLSVSLHFLFFFTTFQLLLVTIDFFLPSLSHICQATVTTASEMIIRVDRDVLCVYIRERHTVDAIRRSLAGGTNREGARLIFFLNHNITCSMFSEIIGSVHDFYLSDSACHIPSHYVPSTQYNWKERANKW